MLFEPWKKQILKLIILHFLPSTKRTLADWSSELLGLLDALFADDGETREYDFLRNGLLALSGYQEQDGFGGEVAFEAAKIA